MLSYKKWNSIAVAAVEAERQRDKMLLSKRMTMELPITYSSMSSLASIQSGFSTGNSLSSMSSASSLSLAVTKPSKSKSKPGRAKNEQDIHLALNTKSSSSKKTKKSSSQRSQNEKYQFQRLEIVDSTLPGDERQYIEIEQPNSSGQKFKLARSIQVRLIGMLRKRRENRENRDLAPDHLGNAAVGSYVSSSSSLSIKDEYDQENGLELRVYDQKPSPDTALLALRENDSPRVKPALLVKNLQSNANRTNRPLSNMFQVVQTLRSKTNGAHSLSAKRPSENKPSTLDPAVNVQLKRHSDVLMSRGAFANNQSPSIMLVNSNQTTRASYDDTVRSEQFKLPLIIKAPQANGTSWSQNEPLMTLAPSNAATDIKDCEICLIDGNGQNGINDPLNSTNELLAIKELDNTQTVNNNNSLSYESSYETTLTSSDTSSSSRSRWQHNRVNSIQPVHCHVQESDDGFVSPPPPPKTTKANESSKPNRTSSTAYILNSDANGAVSDRDEPSQADGINFILKTTFI